MSIKVSVEGVPDSELSITPPKVTDADFDNNHGRKGSLLNRRIIVKYLTTHIEYTYDIDSPAYYDNTKGLVLPAHTIIDAYKIRNNGVTPTMEDIWIERRRADIDTESVKESHTFRARRKAARDAAMAVVDAKVTMANRNRNISRTLGEIDTRPMLKGPEIEMAPYSKKGGRSRSRSRSRSRRRKQKGRKTHTKKNIRYF